MVLLRENEQNAPINLNLRLDGVSEIEKWKQTQKLFNELNNMMDSVFRFARACNIATAEQRITIVAGDLSTTVTTNDTLTTASATDFEFDWTDSRRFSRAVLAPASGVRPMDLRFDLVRADKPGLQGTVFGRTPTTLQAFTWNGSSWDAVGWDVGWVIDLIQFIPGGVPTL